MRKHISVLTKWFEAFFIWANDRYIRFLCYEGPISITGKWNDTSFSSCLSVSVIREMRFWHTGCWPFIIINGAKTGISSKPVIALSEARSGTPSFSNIEAGRWLHVILGVLFQYVVSFNSSVGTLPCDLLSALCLKRLEKNFVNVVVRTSIGRGNTVCLIYEVWAPVVVISANLTEPGAFLVVVIKPHNNDEPDLA